MANLVRLIPIQETSRFVWDFFVAMVFVFILCIFFEPRWVTNDDVGMSMVAHGYGIAAVDMPNLVFSNVIWGYLVRVIPQINGYWVIPLRPLSYLLSWERSYCTHCGN